jgi:tetratricopeptide (TPR) repeat protein
MADSRQHLADLVSEALACQGAEQLERARRTYERLLDSQLAEASLYNQLGLILQQHGKLDEALGCFRRALEIDSRDAATHCNVGAALFAQDLLADAAASFEKAIALEPESAKAHSNLGYMRYCMGQYAEAERHYLRALALEPTSVEANWNLCLLQLLLGDLPAGWERFRQRHAVSPFPRRPQTKPEWEGQALAGETVLLYKEGGFGDTIQFARYAPLVAERGARVILEVQPALTRLFQTLDGVDLLVKRGPQLPEFDFQSNLADLPRIFGTTLETVPAKPYLSANPVLTRIWRKRLGSSGFKVGLVWAGNPGFPDARHKSIPLPQLAPLASCRGIKWVSLQKGAGASELAAAPDGMRLLSFDERLVDFAETAAVIENLDLVITIDTAVAHLAGALGRPVWVLLPLVPDWRWLVEREDSPWYPSVRLFRQTELGTWTSVVERVARELRTTTETHKSQPMMTRLKHALFGRGGKHGPREDAR